MMLGLSIATAVIAAYVGVIDVGALNTPSVIKLATTLALCAGAVLLVAGLVLLLLASKYKSMIAENTFDIDGARCPAATARLSWRSLKSTRRCRAQGQTSFLH